MTTPERILILTSSDIAFFIKSYDDDLQNCDLLGPRTIHLNARAERPGKIWVDNELRRIPCVNRPTW